MGRRNSLRGRRWPPPAPTSSRGCSTTPPTSATTSSSSTSRRTARQGGVHREHNWTWTGGAGQTNNALLIEDDAVAAQYLDYWRRMRADVLPVPDPLSAPMTANQQGAQFRHDNVSGPTFALAGGGTLTTWFSPNMPQRRKPTHPPVPPDLQEVYRLMRLARQGIFFLAFYPGQRGKDCIIGEAIDIGRKDGQLLVMGAMSSPQAMSSYVPAGSGSDDQRSGRPAATRHHLLRSQRQRRPGRADRRRRHRRRLREGSPERGRRSSTTRSW
jgi:hypothetical protein